MFQDHDLAGGGLDNSRSLGDSAAALGRPDQQSLRHPAKGLAATLLARRRQVLQDLPGDCTITRSFSSARDARMKRSKVKMGVEKF